MKFGDPSKVFQWGKEKRFFSQEKVLVINYRKYLERIKNDVIQNWKIQGQWWDDELHSLLL